MSPLDETDVKEVQASEDRVGFLPRRYFEELVPALSGPQRKTLTDELPVNNKAEKPSKSDTSSGWQL